MDDNIVASLRSSAEWIKEMEHESWLDTAELQIEAADAIQQRDDEIVRLRAAGDKVAHTLSVQSEWMCCADGWFGPCGCPPDVATRPTDDSVATALAAWQEARRG